MAALSQAVLDNVANAAFDYYDRKKLYNQHIQTKPLLNALRERQRMFPGGKGELVCNPVFETQSQLEGFEGDDTLTFVNPTPIKEARYPWKLQHLGIQVTTEELMKDGISVTDTNGKGVSEHSSRDVTVIQNIFQAKLDDAAEGFAAGMNEMLWRDGTQSTKDVPGIQFLIAKNPAVGVVGGIDRATQPLWRNVALTTANGATQVTPSTSTQALIRACQKQVRQLRRYGDPKFIILCGSAFMDAIEDEAYAKGTLTQTGFKDEIEAGVGMVTVRGLGTFMYDPTLDDLSEQKFAYFIDTKSIMLRPVEGEDMKKHYPARPHDKMVIYRSWTWAGGLTMKQGNTNMVVEIA
jgi:hypothetical protein